jgi:hypothetical protein
VFAVQYIMRELAQKHGVEAFEAAASMPGCLLRRPAGAPERKQQHALLQLEAPSSKKVQLPASSSASSQQQSASSKTKVQLPASSSASSQQQSASSKKKVQLPASSSASSQQQSASSKKKAQLPASRKMKLAASSSGGQLQSTSDKVKLAAAGLRLIGLYLWVLGLGFLAYQ